MWCKRLLSAKIGQVQQRSTLTCARRRCSTSQSTEKGRTGGIVIFSAISLTAGGLFIWQAQRYFWKKDLIKQLEDRAKEPPISLTSADYVELVTLSVMEQKDDLSGRRVILTGEFDHDNELLLGPRASPPGLVEAAQGMATNPQGYYIITPLKVHDKLTVFVNRGWVPLAAKTWDRPTGKVTIISVSTEPEKGGMLAPVQDQKHLDSRKLLWLDSNILAMFAQQLTGNRSVNLFDVVDDDNTDTKKRIASVPPFAKKINVLSEMFVHPATHLAYAATWFTLCVAGFAMTYLRFRGKGGRGKISKK